MCQQWFSVIGLVFDIVGFLLIVFEWRHMFIRERNRRMEELHYDYERSRVERSEQTYNDPRSGDYTMARLFSKLFIVSNACDFGYANQHGVVKCCAARR